jgi:hypothetical protein
MTGYETVPANTIRHHLGRWGDICAELAQGSELPTTNEPVATQPGEPHPMVMTLAECLTPSKLTLSKMTGELSIPNHWGWRYPSAVRPTGRKTQDEMNRCHSNPQPINK